MVVWWGSPVECASAFARLVRAGTLSATDEERALAALGTLQDTWYEVQATERIRAQALRLLRLHLLRAGDALQLAAALEWAGTPPSGEVVTFDVRLREAARREGFRVYRTLPSSR